jgi:hypothetical protein
VQRLKASGLPVTKLWADRAMFSAAYEALLAVNGMNNGLWSKAQKPSPKGARQRSD